MDEGGGWSQHLAEGGATTNLVDVLDPLRCHKLGTIKLERAKEVTDFFHFEAFTVCWKVDLSHTHARTHTHQAINTALLLFSVDGSTGDIHTIVTSVEEKVTNRRKKNTVASVDADVHIKVRDGDGFLSIHDTVA